MKPLENILNSSVSWNSVMDILIVFAVIILIYPVKNLLKYILNAKLKPLTKLTKSNIDDILLEWANKTIDYTYILVWVYLCKTFVTLPDKVNTLIETILSVCLILVLVYLIQSIVRNLVDYYFESKTKESEKYLSSLIKNIFSVLLWLIWISMILSKLWYNISSLATWIWIWWLAVALAIQPTLSWIFASFAIYVDKPFKIWDMVKISDHEWTITEIWLRSTRLTTFYGNEVILPNADIITQWIENISLRSRIRQDQILWLNYNTDTKKLKKAIDIIRKILVSKKDIIDQEDLRIYFKSFWDYSLNISATYFIFDRISYIERIELISDINLSIKDKFEQEWLELAFPTQTNYIYNGK